MPIFGQHRARTTSATRGRLASLALAVLVVVAACTAWFAYLGYLGGQVLTVLRPPASSGPARERQVAVLFSGDLGFNVGMGRAIAERLVADSIPVVGVNSLAYFRRERSPAEVKALVSDVTRRALSLARADKVILIGQSFGGDVLHVGLTGMPANLRAKVRMVGFVVPTRTVLFQASPSEIFTWAMPEVPALATARQLDWAPVTCIYGVEETDSLCPSWRQRNVHVVGLPGGHPLHRDVDAVYRVLKTAIAASPLGWQDRSSPQSTFARADSKPGASRKADRAGSGCGGRCDA